ncbi:hypothetical protein [Amycolatopsis dendrobii]|uniref:Uncharacterized protein n=1 Tax=Amycolatopsis dendrobii TaxID=2760662 RepID=A0A7W3ZA75_9PSEU|nr:hypothetical protein [Amycolatopsis dendrobii]MBB1153494.1 hypothetical protein [Amycolatopsis dendrobii]
MANAFSYTIQQAVCGMVAGPALCNGTVVAIGKEDRYGYRKVRVSYAKDGEHEYSVSRSGACDYLSPRPMRPTMNDDRVTPNEAYTVTPDADGSFAAAFDGGSLGSFATEAEAWSFTLCHDWEAREAARLAELNVTDAITGCLWGEHPSAAFAAAARGPEALQEFARKTFDSPAPWAGYWTQSLARDLRKLGYDAVDWSKVLERFAR